MKLQLNRCNTYIKKQTKKKTNILANNAADLYFFIYHIEILVGLFLCASLYPDSPRSSRVHETTRWFKLSGEHVTVNLKGFFLMFLKGGWGTWASAPFQMCVLFLRLFFFHFVCACSVTAPQLLTWKGLSYRTRYAVRSSLTREKDPKLVLYWLLSSVRHFLQQLYMY